MVNDGTADIRNAAFTFAGGDYTYTGVRGVSVSGGSAALIDTTFTFGGTDTSGSASSTFTDAIGISAEGGSVKATGLTININSELTSGAPGNQNRGIETSGGTVSLNGDCTINIDGTYSAGILAVTDSSSQIDGETDSIIYGEETETAGKLIVDVTGTPNDPGTADNVLSSTAMSTEGGSINIKSGNVEITSDGLGVTTRSGGGITFSGTTFNVDTTNGTGIYVNGGDITFEKGTVTVTSTIATNNNGATAAHTWSGAPGESSVTSFYDGIVVQGGSLDSTDAVLNVKHKGIDNNYSGAYNELEIRSFAVRVTSVTSDSTSASLVTIPTGKFTNERGGGLYVSGGTVTLGTESTSATGNDSLSISTSGEAAIAGDITYNYRGYFNNGVESQYNNWFYQKNGNGGHAVEVEGGSLTVNSGTYEAAFGNGILVSNGNAVINDGTFSGRDSYMSTENGYVAGVAASYGLKMYGGTLTVDGGNFQSDGSGAFVVNAKAQINAGNFIASGRIGFSIWYGSDVTFGSNNATNDNIIVNGADAAIAVEAKPTGTTVGNSSITIYGGTFAGSNPNHENNDGIWYGESSTTLTINGGIFSPAKNNSNGYTGRAALQIAESDPSLTINGGTFYGTDPITTSTGWWDTTTYYSPIRSSGNIRVNVIIKEGYTMYGYTEVNADVNNTDGTEIEPNWSGNYPYVNDLADDKYRILTVRLSN